MNMVVSSKLVGAVANATLRQTRTTGTDVANGFILTADGRRVAFRAWREMAVELASSPLGSMYTLMGDMQTERFLDRSGSWREAAVYVVASVKKATKRDIQGQKGAKGDTKVA